MQEGTKRLEFKCNVVCKVVDYLKAFTAWKLETLKQFYVVMHIQWICLIAKTLSLRIGWCRL